MIINSSIFGQEKDRYFMQQAFLQADIATTYNEVPIGAVVVNADGIIIGAGYNQVETHKCQNAHAEMQAIDNATRTINNWRLLDCWLYVTLEPCLMCMGLIRLSRLKGVVYGASSPLFSFRLDNSVNSPVYKEDTLILINNILAEKAQLILKNFFQQKRKHTSE